MEKTHRTAFIEIGVIARPHGIAGEVKVRTSPGYLGALQGVRRVFIGESETGALLISHRVHQNALLIKLEGIADRNAAETLRGKRVSIKTPDLPRLKQGEYYAHELVGITVLNIAGQALGRLAEVLATGSNDVYIIKTSTGTELLLPAIDSVIRQINLDDGTMTVAVPDGLNG